MSAPTHPVLLVLAGPSSSGKSTLCDRLVAAGLGFKRVVTATTRAPRTGEINGIHYHFLSPLEFDQKADEFLEWAWVHGERRYGTLKSSVLEPLIHGQDLVMSIDVKGVRSLRNVAATTPVLKRALTTVFIRVDHEMLLARARLRGQDDEFEIGRRMITAEGELLAASAPDLFDFIIDSNSRDEDFAELLKIVEKARARAASDH